MRERGPFDRIAGSDSPPRDRSANVIFIALGIIGVVLFVLVASPFSIFGGDDDPNLPDGAGTALQSSGGRGPKIPDGYEALSRLFDDLEAPKDTAGPYALRVSLLQPLTDGRNLGLYTYRNGNWERISSATLVDNGAAASGEVPAMPSNVAVLRLTAGAVRIGGVLPPGAQPDPEALGTVSTMSPLGVTPAIDGHLIGSAAFPGRADGNVVPVVRATTQQDDEAVNSILASPATRDQHINALVELALDPGNAGIEIDYPRVNPARKADFTAFVNVLSDRLHQANRTLTVSLPAPLKTGVTWDTGAYDWPELSARADTLKLAGEPDPSNYYRRMEEVLDFLRDKVDFKKVSLVVTRFSFEKASDGLRPLTLHEALGLATGVEVRTASQITPNSSVVLVGKNIFLDDGATGLQWDDAASAVAFEYPGRGGQRKVWLENSLSMAFRLDLARRYGLGGITVDNVANDPTLPAVWELLRNYAGSGNVSLVKANSVLLRPTWTTQAGQTQSENKGNLIWTAPAQPGSYDVSLIVSDGIIRASRKLVLEVRAPAPQP